MASTAADYVDINGVDSFRITPGLLQETTFTCGSAKVR